MLLLNMNQVKTYLYDSSQPSWATKKTMYFPKCVVPQSYDVFKNINQAYEPDNLCILIQVYSFLRLKSFVISKNFTNIQISYISSKMICIDY